MIAFKSIVDFFLAILITGEISKQTTDQLSTAWQYWPSCHQDIGSREVTGEMIDRNNKSIKNKKNQTYIRVY